MALIISLSIIGLLLVVAEIILIPGIFVTGVLGLVSMAASCWLAFDGYGSTVGTVTVASDVVLTVAAVTLSLRSKTWNKVSLHTEIDSRADSSPEEKGIAVGSEGVTVTRLNPMGKVLFGDTAVECAARGGIVDPGQKVAVVLIEDNKIYVKPI
ncbi:MAG TPA: serine protease [Candidatus Coprenecus pullistercoris]|nr:serine protease [Candidatus Coprenecus pullistercoris]